MQQIFVYADSLSWGIIPNTRERLPLPISIWRLVRRLQIGSSGC